MAENRRNDREQSEFEERVVSINRVTKVVKGGRRLRFAALVVVGDRNGRVGFGTGKAQEVPEAIRKAIEAAKKNLITVPMVGTTLPHEALGVFGGGKILLKPAVEALELPQVVPFVPSSNSLVFAERNIKIHLVQTTPINVVRATVDGLNQLKRAEEVAALRGKSVSDSPKEEKMAQIKITLVNSPIGRIPAQRKTVKALGSW